MDGDILEARHKTIIEQLPSWCLKLATEEQPVTVGLENIRDDKKRVSFNCRCGRVSDSFNIHMDTDCMLVIWLPWTWQRPLGWFRWDLEAHVETRHN